MSYNAKQAQLDGKPLTMTDRLIMLRSNLTHSEFRFSNRYGGISFSFTMADGANGARFKAIKYSHPKRWEKDVIPLTDEQEDMIFKEACRLVDVPVDFLALANVKFCQGANHAKYDLIGLLIHATKKSKKWWLNGLRFSLWCWTLPIKPSDTASWCSEGCAYLVGMVHKIGVSPDSLDPQELHELLQRMFCKGQVWTNANDQKAS